MKTTADMRRARDLLSAIADAKEWRETVEDYGGHAVAFIFGEGRVYSEAPDASQGYEGGFKLPADLAIKIVPVGRAGRACGVEKNRCRNLRGQR